MFNITTQPGLHELDLTPVLLSPQEGEVGGMLVSGGVLLQWDTGDEALDEQPPPLEFDEARLDDRPSVREALQGLKDFCDSHEPGEPPPCASLYLTESTISDSILLRLLKLEGACAQAFAVLQYCISQQVINRRSTERRLRIGRETIQSVSMGCPSMFRSI